MAIVIAPMARYFFDFEFLDRGQQVDIISLGICADDGRGYYAVRAGFDQLPLTPWLMENVVPKLPWDGELTRYVRTLDQMAQEVRQFVIGAYPEFWGACVAYDWYLLCSLFGGMLQKPDWWPHYANDVHQLIRQVGGRPPGWPKADPALEHNAFYDAIDTRNKWQVMHNHLQSRGNVLITI